MRVVIQRVSSAQVTIDNELYADINNGFLIFLGVEYEDTEDDIEWLTSKIIGLRIFSDSEGLMNLNLQQINGSVLIVSQFTLFASTKKGNRPSFIKSAKPEIAIPQYESFVKRLKEKNIKVQTGKFGADMKVSLTNDGPVTIIIDSKMRE